MFKLCYSVYTVSDEVWNALIKAHISYGNRNVSLVRCLNSLGLLYM